MHLLYLDDSGEERNPGEQYIVLGGIAVFERRAYWVSKQLDSIAEDTVGKDTDPASLEFHASAVWAGNEPLLKGRSRKERGQLIKDVLRVLADEDHGVVAFACAVHKESRPNPLEVAFEDVCSRFDLLLKRLYQSGDPQRGLIIIDRSKSARTLRALANNFRTVGTRWGVLNNLAETPLFIDSRASRLMQLADHVAWSVFRRYEYGDASFIDLISHKFDTDGMRIHGLVHKHPGVQQTCGCPACVNRRVTTGTAV